MPAKKTKTTAKTATTKRKAAAKAKAAAPVIEKAPVTPKRQPKHLDPVLAATVGTALGIGLHTAGLM